MSDWLRIVERIDGLYEDAVVNPAGITDRWLSDWLADTFFDEAPDKATLRHVRRAMRLARKLADRWAADTPPTDWRNAVDDALGGPGWKPALEILRHALEIEPESAVFEEMRRRFRVVYSEPYEGTLEDYLA